MSAAAVAADVARCLEYFRPAEVPGYRKVRVGREWDGGYILIDDLGPVTSVYSFGIGPDLSFEDDLARRGKRVLAHDPYVGTLPQGGPMLRVFAEGLGPTGNAGGLLHPVDHYVHRNGDASDTDMILKVDVEGAEYEALACMEPGTLRNFRQVVIEFHDLLRLEDAGFRALFLRAVQALCQRFAVSHVHANNCAPVSFVYGLACADVLEVSFVRRSSYRTCSSDTVYPTVHDRPNDFRVPDHLLWFYPFLPGMSSVPAYEASLHSSRVQIGA